MVDVRLLMAAHSGPGVTTDVLERVRLIELPPELLRDILHGGGALVAPDSPDLFAASIAARVGAMGIEGEAGDVVLAARLRVLALARVLRDHFVETPAAPSDENDVVFLNRAVFVAATDEPLIVLSDGHVGFDPGGLRSRLMRLVGARA